MLACRHAALYKTDVDSNKNKFGSGRGNAVHNNVISPTSRPPGDPAVVGDRRVGQVQALAIAIIGDAKKRRFRAAVSHWKVLRTLGGVA